MKKRLIITCMLIAYAAILIKVMVLKDIPVIRIGGLIFNFGGTHDGPANLVPFKTILPYLLGDKGLIIAFINLAGNIVLLVPIGFLFPFILPKLTWKKMLALAVATGLVIEGMQALLHVGIFDIDDIILNALGVMIGYWAFTILADKKRIVKPNTIIITAAIVIVIVAAVAFYGVHVFQERRLPERFQPVTVKTKSDSNEDNKISIQGNDPCGGTGGTGRIVRVGNNSITIKRHDNTTVIVNFTLRTTISNSAGIVSRVDLKPGYNVTIVTDLNREGPITAMAVLVCN